VLRALTVAAAVTVVACGQGARHRNESVTAAAKPLHASVFAGARHRDGSVTIGRSARGRAIVAYERGNPTAPATLVVGVIHGSEPAGLAVIRDLRTMPLPVGVHLWLVPTINPDGLAAHTRQNAHGVDLNRNWPVDWKLNGVPWDGYYSGPRPMSEPENRAMRAFILKVKPALTIWYHQPLDEVYGSDPHVAVLKRYARLSGLPYHRLVAPPGAATRWERRHFPRGVHFVAEFPAGRISAATARRNARAVLALAPRATKTASARRSVALVTVESENRLLAVDLGNGRVARWWKLPADPENVEAYAGQAAVVSTKAGAVTILDTRTLRVERVIRGLGSPHIAAWSPDGEYAYVTDDARGQLDVIRNRIIRRIFVGYGAHHLAFSPDQKRLWVVLGERARSIAVVDTHNPTRPRLIGHVSPRGLAHDAAFTPDGRYVWVAYDDRPYLRVFDARTRRPVTTINAGSPPAHVRFDDASGLARYGRFAYVTSGNDAVLRVYDWRTRRFVRTLRTAPGSFNLSVDHGLVATSSLTSGELTAFDGARLLLAAQVAPVARDVALVP
jgi:protein MpaA